MIKTAKRTPAEKKTAKAAANKKYREGLAASRAEVKTAKAERTAAKREEGKKPTREQRIQANVDAAQAKAGIAKVAATRADPSGGRIQKTRADALAKAQDFFPNGKVDVDFHIVKTARDGSFAILEGPAPAKSIDAHDR